MSFRRRLLLLILAVSLLQVLAAFATFRDTTSTPHRLRYEAQLQEAVNKVLVAAAAHKLQSRTEVINRAANDQSLLMAVAGGSKQDMEQALRTVAAGDDSAPLYITDAGNKVLAGDLGTLPLVDGDAVQLEGPAGAKRYLHAPIVANQELLSQANELSSAMLFVVNDRTLVTARKSLDAPADVTASCANPNECFRYMKIGDKNQYVHLRRAGDSTWFGSAIPAHTLAAASADGKTKMWLFFGALAILSVIVAWIVTTAVEEALAVFSRRARRIGDGHLDERIPVVGDDQVAAASTAFNIMAEQLKERIEGLVAAEARLERQVRLFGDVLTNEDEVDAKLAAVCQVATETTAANQARFWRSGEAQFTLAAEVNLSVEHADLSPHEVLAMREQRIVRYSDAELSVIVAPAIRDDECLGMLTLCTTEAQLSDRDVEFAGRFAAQAAVAIDNARLNDAMKSEHRLLANSFSQYVPASVVEQLLERGETVELGGAQHEVSVLFMDIRGFTAWSESLQPTQVVTELNELLAVLSDCVFETEGTLDKFTGDGLMALWSAPLEQEDHADRACRTAMLMADRLREFNEEKGVDAFRIGVGIHSGLAVVGNIGHDRRHDYTAIGDTVNLSARIEAATKELGATVLVSQATIDRAGPDIVQQFTRVGDISVKGRSQQVTVYRRATEFVHLSSETQQAA